jgi:DNA primase
MRFSPQFLDELRARLPVSEVVGRRVKLKKSGSEWRGLSPFNKEKTPSFFVNDNKCMWFDFSAGKNGNIFDFLMLTEGLSFPEAVERLADEAGMALPKMTTEEIAREQRGKTIAEITELAARFFEATLASRAGARARGYLADRGIDTATALRFRIGYAANERFALKEHLGRQGISTNDMVEAGLLVSAEEIPLPYDRFRDRVMFPITDVRNRVIAFGGRALEADVTAKYLNSPETPLFHKGATLYNIAGARAAAHKGAPVIAVEGYVDVIAMVQAGYEATVAPLGTALTVQQLELLWRLAEEPLLCFDGDAAGRRASYRAIDLALPLLAPGKSLKFVRLPEGHDPDDLLRAGGREALDAVIGTAQPLAEALWAREIAAGSLDTPERCAAFEARLARAAAAVGDETVRKYYRSEFKERLRRLFGGTQVGPAYPPGGRAVSLRSMARPVAGWAGAGWAGSATLGTRSMRKQPHSSGRGGTLISGPYVPMSPQLTEGPLHRGYHAAIPRREALILQAVIHHPWILHDHLEELSDIELRHSEASRLKAALIDIFAHDPGISADGIMHEIERRGMKALAERVEKATTTLSVWGAGREAAPDDVLVTWTQLIASHRQWHSLAKELKDAESALGRDTTQANYSWLQDVKARLSKFEGTEAVIEGFGTQSGRPVRAL